MTWSERLAEVDARLARQGERLAESLEDDQEREEKRRHGWKVDRHRAGRRVPWTSRPPEVEEERLRRW